MLLRNIAKAALGKATPRQTILATTLGGILGFVPGVFLLGVNGAFAQSPGLLLSLLFLVLVLNANLAIFGLTLLVAKVVGLLLLPVSFEVGRLLLDGPTGPLFGALINAPVFAWFGLEYYATTGALPLGLVFGVALGFLLVRVQRGLRQKLATLEEDSAGYQKWASKKSVRFCAWLLLGAKQGKRSWREQAEDSRKGLPVRLVGVGIVVVLAAGLFVAQTFLTSSAFRSAAQTGLESWNGATVDLAHAAVDLAGGKIEISGLAMADPQALDTNTFDARTLALQIGTADLLKKRLVVEEITSGEAATGSKRAPPGERIHSPVPPEPPPPEGGGAEKTLDDYLQDAEVWQGRLQRVADLVRGLLGPADEAADTPEARAREVESQVEQLGLARAAAKHLIEGAPMLLVRKLTFEGVTATQLGAVLDVHGKNLSTQPRLVPEPLELSLRSRDDRIAIETQAAGGNALRARLAWKGISSETIASLLETSPMRGGTVDLAFDGALDASRPEGLWIEAPLRVTLHDTVLVLPGLPEAKIDTLTVPLGLRGPLAAPRITVDQQKVADALVAAGKKELANQLRGQLDGVVPEVGGKVGDLIEGNKDPAQLLEEEKKKAEEAARKKAEEELKKALPGGLLGGKKKQ